jgi:hypothetical protein
LFRTILAGVWKLIACIVPRKASFVVAVLLPVLSMTADAAQLKRMVSFGPSTKFAPLVVDKVTLGNNLVQQGRYQTAEMRPIPTRAFRAGDDWVENITVYLLNRTNQAIVYFWITFSFPVDSEGSARAFFNLRLGRVPSTIELDQNRKLMRRPLSEPIEIPPSETIAIRMSDYVDRIKEAVEPTIRIADARQMSVDVQPGVYFAGGMIWDGGYRVFDPQAHIWRAMERDFFPGDPEAHWPKRLGWAR